MTRMIPARPRRGANVSETRIFDAFAGSTASDDWIVLHSLEVRRHAAQFQGEADFIVLVPGRGIVVIEAKSPEYVEYKDGEWRLDRVPNPGKSPFGQLDGSIRSIRGFLKARGVLNGSEPITRLVWFTSLERHMFNNGSPGDMQFFEWELAWRGDLQHPVRAIEKVLEEHDAWYYTVENVEHDPDVMTAAHVEEIAATLLGDFAGGRTLADRKLERLDEENRLLKDQRLVLDMVECNDHVYFDGPAGTGKSYLLTQLAKRWRSDKRTLVICWNLLMADELRDALRAHRDIVVDDLNTLMLRLAGLTANPDDATPEWYSQELPALALAALHDNPALGGYEAICVDEFQDIASFPFVLDVVFALAGTGSATGTKLAFAGDSRQQILRRTDAHVDPYAVAKERVPDLMHLALRRGLRQVAGLTGAAEGLLSRTFGYRSHRVASAAEGALSVKSVSDPSKASHALAEALRGLLEHHQAHDIVILSLFGVRHSLVGRLLAAENFSKEERWLRDRLRVDSALGTVDVVTTDAAAEVEIGSPSPKPLAPKAPAGRVRWGSIFKYKGLDAEAVILTDIGDEGLAFVTSAGLSWFDLLYVGLTRARYRCVVVAN
ncbi:nuclease-related domain-containing DEAD/DEAH box helicase [Microbacterium sp. SD291]|uniref:nuclease-related domain-containing DEAD/DEAH box helicase n=1 Tax=Microbacterium sp. SD291 TaxID=2782007 RepID=UPI001A97562D|nr:NERD domain-containing protein [Microbacterium sp. SD291]MBO0981971.1 NERD domain-containing protein [Microbacterium sp. SD291]